MYIFKIKNIHARIMATSKYILHDLNLIDGQLEKIIRASQNKESVVVRISKYNSNGNLHKIPLTKTQEKRIPRSKTVTIFRYRQHN